MSPPLATVEQALASMGKSAASLVVRMRSNAVLLLCRTMVASTGYRRRAATGQSS